MGSYEDQAGVTHGFYYQDGAPMTYDYQGATSTVLTGIDSDNNLYGVAIVGGKTVSFETQVSF